MKTTTKKYANGTIVSAEGEPKHSLCVDVRGPNT
jgi:hypothetical protein